MSYFQELSTAFYMLNTDCCYKKASQLLH